MRGFAWALLIAALAALQMPLVWCVEAGHEHVHLDGHAHHHSHPPAHGDGVHQGSDDHSHTPLARDAARPKTPVTPAAAAEADSLVEARVLVPRREFRPEAGSARDPTAPGLRTTILLV